MSREVRRVPTDFDWPLNKVWQGYLMPDEFREEPCPDCYRVGYMGDRQGGSGSTASAGWLHAILYLVAMLADDQRAQSFEGTEHQFTAHGDDRSKLHPYLARLQNVYEHRRPSADVVELVKGISGRDDEGLFGFDCSTFAYKAIRVLAKAADLPKNWGTCPGCDGHGTVERYEGQRADGEKWCDEEHSPPTGEGWQYWETVSEGSPISPVFDSAEGLAQWLTKPHMNSDGVSIETARRIVADGWVPSGMVTAAKGVESGEQAYESGTI